ncbi:MAG: FAD-dependent oxidoreductase [Microbacterium sp.]|nr:MAG: FAD-dependent oxidoreductase [Microbacterium sp.]
MTDADVIIIVGGGVGGLVVAHDLARAGRRVIVCEASDRVGGLLRRGTLAGLDLDLGAESFATRTDAVAALVADAGLGLDLVEPRPGGAFLAVATDAGAVRAPLPRRTVLGIPADPRAADIVALIGADAAARAAEEPSLSPYTPDADEPSLYDLVAERLGPVVAHRLVNTLCRSVYSRPASAARLSTLHPGLWRAFLAHGSLVVAAGEVAQTARAGASVGGISGGMWRLPEALADAARRHGAQVRTGAPVIAIDDDGDAPLVVRTSEGALTASRVVVATGQSVADRLLGVPPTPATQPAPPDGRVRVVAAAIDHAGLDGYPVGSGVIVDPALPTAAKALTHVTAKWEWAAAAAPAGRHLVRLSARAADGAGLATSTDVAREVELLTGVAVRPEHVVDLVVQDWTDAVSTPADDDSGPARAEAITRAARRGIHRAGAAVAGTGLASVIPHARALAADLLAELDGTPDLHPIHRATDSAAHPARSLA